MEKAVGSAALLIRRSQVRALVGEPLPIQPVAAAALSLAAMPFGLSKTKPKTRSLGRLSAVRRRAVVVRTPRVHRLGSTRNITFSLPKRVEQRSGTCHAEKLRKCADRLVYLICRLSVHLRSSRAFATCNRMIRTTRENWPSGQHLSIRDRSTKSSNAPGFDRRFGLGRNLRRCSPGPTVLGTTLP